MNLRKLLLRVMLGSLAAAAALGVLAMLFFHESVIAQVIGTAVATAVAAGLMIVLSLLGDREKSRSVGTLGMAAVVAEYLMGLFMIWGAGAYWSYSWDDAVGIFMLAIAGTLLPAMFYLRMTYVPLSRIAAWVGVGVCAVVFCLFAIPPFFIDRTASYDHLCGTAVCLGLFGVAATASLAGAGFDRRHWRYLGVLAAVVGAVMGTIGIWRETDTGQLAFAIVASLAAVVAHANLVLLCPLKPSQRWLAWATIICTVLTAAGLDAITGMVINGGSDMLERTTGAAGILAGCGSLSLLILAGLNRKFKPKATLSPIDRYTLICPGCNRKQTLPVGDACCPTCMLGIHVSFTEPRCPKCDYLLYMLQSDRCPECGTVVRGAATTDTVAITPVSDPVIPPASI